MAEVLETQEQFPVQAGIQNVDETIGIKSWTPAFAGVTNTFFSNVQTSLRLSTHTQILTDSFVVNLTFITNVAFPTAAFVSTGRNFRRK